MAGQGSAGRSIATIGYQAATVRSLLEALTEDGVGIVADVRAVASSRRPGFAKTALAANLATAGIGYRHLRELGTPAEGRAAARAGHHDTMRGIFRAHLATPAAQAGLDELAELVKSGSRVALLCFEVQPEHCHRSLVADALRARLPVEVTHLIPDDV